MKEISFEPHYSIGGHEQKGSAAASQAEAEYGQENPGAEKKNREDQARVDMQNAFDQYSANASLIPLDDLDHYVNAARIYLEAVNDPNNNLRLDKKLVMMANDIINESSALAA
ncbi:MAG: hypothetical protein WCX69_02450 [Candidatus Paceibacterota bacterium]